MVKQDQRLYSELKPKIQAIVRKQRELCDGYLRDAEKLCAQAKENGNNSDLDFEIGILMYRAQMGQPKHPSLLKLKTNPDNLRRLNDSEMELHKDQTKKELYAQKEFLFFAMDEKSHDADLSEKGRDFLSPNDPEAFMMPDVVTAHHEIDVNEDLTPQERLAEKQRVQAESEERGERIHVTSQLLKAYCIYERDQQYIVADNKVVIVDEHTGRAMEGRRWSDGLHQAVEAKEGVRIEAETQTYATITIQNYFRLYLKLAGMTGTAETEANEFLDIYNMGVLVIPTDQVCVRDDRNDSIYLSTKEKYQAVIEEVKKIHGEGRPILVGTVAVETSEHMASLLKKEHIPHSVLNAKYHAQEAPSPSPPTWPGAAPTSNSPKASPALAGSTCSAPSATNRAGSIASYAAVARGRAIRAAPTFSSVSRMTSCGCTAPATRWAVGLRNSAWKRVRKFRIRCSTAPSGPPRNAWSNITIKPAAVRSSTMM
jgi:preprotein translocase subunit SecA